MITAHRYNELKANPALLLPEERESFLGLLDWENRSAAAKQAVRTKRAKYDKWPCNRKTKKKTMTIQENKELIASIKIYHGDGGYVWQLEHQPANLCQNEYLNPSCSHSYHSTLLGALRDAAKTLKNND